MQKKGTNKIIAENRLFWQLLGTISPQTFRESFGRIEGFLKNEVRTFWREYFETC